WQRTALQRYHRHTPRHKQAQRDSHSHCGNGQGQPRCADNTTADRHPTVATGGTPAATGHRQ
ncbi:hypothetical protein SARC_14705, partial [Sphaeroforma arctica JP610]